VKTWYTSRKITPGSRYFAGTMRLLKYTQLTTTRSATVTARIHHSSTMNEE
jgi:hypothetical protein